MSIPTVAITGKVKRPNGGGSSDGGRVFNKKGIINASTPRSKWENWDFCDKKNPNILFEYYCHEKSAKFEKYPCPNGCKDGACLD